MRSFSLLLLSIVAAPIILAQDMSPDAKRMIENVMARDCDGDGVLRKHELTQGFSSVDKDGSAVELCARGDE